MALAVGGTTPAFVVSGSANPVSTAAFSPPANSFLLALCIADELNTFSVAGGSLTWAAIDNLSASGFCSLAAFWAYASSAPGSMTVASTRSGSFTANGVKCVVFSGAESIFSGAHNKASSNTLSLTATADNSWLWAAFGNEADTTSDTAGTGCTWNDAEVDFGGAGISGGILRRTTADGLSSVSSTISAGSTATQRSILAVEIKPASAAAPVVPLYTVSSYGSYH